MKNRRLTLSLVGLLLSSCVCLAAAQVTAQSNGGQDRDTPKPLQHAVASKTAKFDTVSKTDESYGAAFDAHDLAGAYKKVGQKGAFKGTVSNIYEERDGDLLILNFDPQYRTALNAVLKNPDFPKFPDMKELKGKEILVSGDFVDYRGKAEIILTDPGQIKIIK